MDLEGLKIEKKDHVAIIRILDSQDGLSGVVRLAQEVFERIIRFDNDIRVVILEEKGKGAFCIGEEILARIPLNRWGTPKDAGGATVFLVSSASNYITGQTIYIDGGWLAYF